MHEYEHHNHLSYVLETILAISAISLGHFSKWLVVVNPILSTISLTLGIVMLMIRLYGFFMNWIKTKK